MYHLCTTYAALPSETSNSTINDLLTRAPNHTPSYDSFAHAQVGMLHYPLMILTVVAEAPPLGIVAQDAKLEWANAWNVGLALAESVKFRHAAAVGLFLVGFVRQHEAIVHLASLRGPAAGAGGSKVCVYVCVCAASDSTTYKLCLPSTNKNIELNSTPLPPPPIMHV